MCFCVGMYVHMGIGAPGSHKRMSESLVLVLQVVVNYPIPLQDYVLLTTTASLKPCTVS